MWPLQESKKTNNIVETLRNNEAIRNHTVDGSLMLDFSKIEFSDAEFSSISFQKVHFKGPFTLRNLKIQRANISFQECTFEQRTIIENVEVLDPYGYGLRFLNCSAQGNSDVNFKSLKMNHIHVDRSSLKLLHISNVALNEFWMQKCGSSKSLWLEEIECPSLYIENEDGGEIDSINILSPRLENISIYAHKRIDNLVLRKFSKVSVTGTVNRILLESESFKSLEVANWIEKDRSIKSKIGKFEMRWFSYTGIIDLYDLNLGELNLKSVNSNSGVFRLNQVDIGKTVIEDCSISKFRWNQITFLRAPKILRSDLSGLKMSNVKWKEGRELASTYLRRSIPTLYFLRKKQLTKKNKGFSDEQIGKLKNERDIYRQLKISASNSHNKVEALAFYKNEMQLYWKQVRIEGGIPWYDRVLVFTNRWTSNFGQDWYLPLIWFGLIHVLFYLYLIDFQLTFTWEAFWAGIDQSFPMLNPVHKTPEFILNGQHQAAHVIMRLIHAFLIYHFIRATRKFTTV